MTHDEIIKLVREAAARHGHTLKDQPSPETVEFIVELVAMAAAAEREECAKVCVASDLIDWPTSVEIAAIRKCAAAIRARNKE